MKKTVYLLFGGQSPEHEISIITAKQIRKHLDEALYNIFPIYLNKSNEFFYISDFEHFNLFPDFKKLHLRPLAIAITKGKVTFSTHKLKNLPSPDVCVLAFHGGIGEGGDIQGFLDLLDLPYTGPSLTGAVYGMDKVLMKYVFEKNDIATLPWMYVTKDQWLSEKQNILSDIKAFCPYPLIVKPAMLGSSIGVKKVENDEDLADTIGADFLYDNRVIIEKFGEHMMEVNCSVRQVKGICQASQLEQVNETKEIFSYDEKYLKGGKKKVPSTGMASAARTIPAPLPEYITKQVQQTAINIYTILQAQSLVRIDFLIDLKNERIYPIEINTIPGSLSFYLWEAEGMQFHTVLDDMIDEAIANHTKKHKRITSFDSPLWNE